MGSETDKAGQSYPLKKTLRKALASIAIASALASFAWLGTSAPLEAAGETRSIAMFHVHTKESINITYMQNGRYIPSAMKKINYFMRDWRRNATVTIDPRTLDLMWELHADLGSNRPIHIVCGFRSGKTNAFLKRKGRNVAKKSQHVKGKAIDFYFPDVPTVKIRNSALVRRVGGVGYYRSSGGPTGFLHVDTGNVRHWGPAISKSQWASIFREGKKTLGRRKSRGIAETVVASAEGETEGKKSVLGWITGRNKKATPIPEVAEEEIAAPNYTGFDEDLAELASDVANEPKSKTKKAAATVDTEDDVETPDVAKTETPVAVVKPAKKQSPNLASAALASLSQAATTEQQAEVQLVEEDAGEAPAEIKRGVPIPKPRLKPAQVLNLAMASAAAINIEPASALPDSFSSATSAKTKVLTAKVAPAKLRLIESETVVAELEEDHETVKTGKSDFAAEIRAGETNDVPFLIRPLVAAAATVKTDMVVASLVTEDLEQQSRLNGRPAPLDAEEESVLPKAAVLPDAPSSEASGKGDMQVVNREGKGNLELIPN